jgi:hypothetical protein
MCGDLWTTLTFSTYECVIQFQTDGPHSADEISSAGNSSTWVDKTGRTIISWRKWTVCLSTLPTHVNSVLCCFNFRQFTKTVHFNPCVSGVSFLGAFAKLRKATTGFVISVCLSVHPSVRMEQLGSHWMGFHENLRLNIFRRYVEKIQGSLESNKTNGYFIWRQLYPFNHISLNSS